ncbi:MAG: TerB family tellurite resistance protein [Planctomycetes bacterium]|nr:TerB family tellurite resistance protein [Planctomycetota bacterium]
MDSTKFKKILFEVACCAVACDYDIDEREIRELRNIDKSTTYFKDIDLSKQLDNFLDNFKGNEVETINELVEKIKKAPMSPVEELLVMEITLRLIYSDLRIDEKEIDFLKSIRLALSISDEIITDRFGKIDTLIKEQKIVKPVAEKIIEKHGFDSADLENLENIYIENDEKKNKKK